MNAQNFRIGNYLKVTANADMNEFIGIVLQISKEEIYIGKNYSDNGLCCNLHKDIEPIPITHEVLTSLGFVKYEYKEEGYTYNS